MFTLSYVNTHASLGEQEICGNTRPSGFGLVWSQDKIRTLCQLFLHGRGNAGTETFKPKFMFKIRHQNKIMLVVYKQVLAN